MTLMYIQSVQIACLIHIPKANYRAVLLRNQGVVGQEGTVPRSQVYRAISPGV